MKERIRHIRDYSGLSQAEFSRRINVAQSTLAQFETGAREPKDIHLTAICREFDINMEWLRFGVGEMLSSNSNSTIDQVVAKHHLRPLEKTMLEAFLTLPEAYRNGVLEYVKAIVSSVVAQDGEEYRTILEQQAEQENQSLRASLASALDDGSQGNQKAHA